MSYSAEAVRIFYDDSITDGVKKERLLELEESTERESYLRALATKVALDRAKASKESTNASPDVGQ